MTMTNSPITAYNLVQLAMPTRLMEEVLAAVSMSDPVTIAQFMVCPGSVPHALRAWVKKNVVQDPETGKLVHRVYRAAFTGDSITLVRGDNLRVYRMYQLQDKKPTLAMQLVVHDCWSSMTRWLVNEDCVTVTNTNTLYPDAPQINQRVEINNNIFLSEITPQQGLHQTRRIVRLGKDPKVFHAQAIANGVDFYWDWKTTDFHVIIRWNNGIQVFVKWARNNTAVDMLYKKVACLMNSTFFNYARDQHFRNTRNKRPVIAY